MQNLKLKIMPRNESASENVNAKSSFSIYEALWLFITGSVVGFIVEIIWCVIRTGRLENRASMIFGPFTAIYGIGAMILYLISIYAKNKNLFQIFALGAAGLTTMEYFCSLFQETLFGSVSWDYSKRSFNIGGRVCLMYSVCWGLLAILWVIMIQPQFGLFISKIPARIYKPLTWGLAAFLIIDIMISAAAVSRWGMRLDGSPPAGIIAETVDRLFPNDFMVKVYPNMHW